jgi:hypothetical protein
MKFHAPRRLGVALRSALAGTCLIAAVTVAFPAAAQADSSWVAGRYTWAQGQPPVRMQPTSAHVCVLTRVGGNFRGAGEAVSVYQANGMWMLGGRSQQDGVNAAATCFRMSSFNTPQGNARWISPEMILSWQVGGDCDNRSITSWWGDAATFLSGISGDFAGDGEYAYVDQSQNGFAPSVINSNACQEGDVYTVQSHAFFAGKPHTGHLPSYIGPDIATGRERVGTVKNVLEYYTSAADTPFGHEGHTVMAPATSAMCYLTGVKGKLRGDGEYVEIVPETVGGVQRWVLRSSSGQDGTLWGHARCYARNQ